MNKIVLLISLCLFIVLSNKLSSQTIKSDTTLANQNFETANNYFQKNSLDTAITHFQKASLLYEKHQQWEKYLLCKISNAMCLQKKWQFDEAIKTLKQAISKTNNEIKENRILLGDAYNEIALSFFHKSNLDEAISYWKKSSAIYKNVANTNNNTLAREKQVKSMYYIAWQLTSQSKFEQSLEKLDAALAISLKYLGDSHEQTSILYVGYAYMYSTKKEYDLALQYFFKALQIQKLIYGEKHFNMHKVYNNIGIIYSSKAEYDKAIEYFSQSIEILIKYLGEKNKFVAKANNNLGYVYYKNKQYKKALEFYNKSLITNKEIIGEKNDDVATIYSNIGVCHIYLDRSDTAEVYFNKCSNIFKEIHGEKAPRMPEYCKYHAEAYQAKGDYDRALLYSQKGIYYNVNGFRDSIDVTKNPVWKNYSNGYELLISLNRKAEILLFYAKNNKKYKGLSQLQLLGLSNETYLIADSLINHLRKITHEKSDKISLGEYASNVYPQAVDACMNLAKLNKDKKFKELQKRRAFYYSEKNKSTVLAASLDHANALQFGGLPDSIIMSEKSLQKQISSYMLKLAAKQDSTTEMFTGELFEVKRKYDNLIKKIETNYPNYYNLKHSSKTISIDKIKENLNKSTALVSYLTTDSIVYIFVVTQKSFEIYPVVKGQSFDRQVKLFRLGIISNNKKIYAKAANNIYAKLFPEKCIPEKIKSLIIIPDGNLLTIPFEALLTSKSNNGEYKNLFFLIKDYSISYAYSATLWFNSTKKTTNTQNKGMLAIAPVFADKNSAGISIQTRSFLSGLDKLINDSLPTRGGLLNGTKIASLPASEKEVKDIFNLYRKKNLSAIAKTHQFANETFVKSDTISQYKFIHIATHGFVNSEKPELSGILLAQDNTTNEDGILYSGEIYNLNLNADLVVLSACETGLGQLKRGEGVIGLTRSLMYAGADNLIVSLWRVADKSTSRLMVDFYTEVLNVSTSNKAISFKEQLRNAKLKTIKDGKYANPFYWSPFVLIGK